MMSKYHSEFIVTYLKDLFALHLALNKTQEQLVELVQQRCALDQNIPRAVAPMIPHHEAANGVFSLGAGLFSFMLSGLSFLYKFALCGWFFVLLGMMSIVIALLQYRRVSQENSRQEHHYQEKLEIYQTAQRKNEEQQQAICAIDNEIHQCQTEIEQAWRSLRQVYRVNLIPKSHRNMDSTILLYHWFDTGIVDDLDAALEMVSLEQNKEQLQRIITEAGEDLLEQYQKMAQQRQHPVVQQAYTLLMQSKLDQLDLSEDDQQTYLSMIESNHTAMAYFAKAKYIEQLSH